MISLQKLITSKYSKGYAATRYLRGEQETTSFPALLTLKQNELLSKAMTSRSVLLLFAGVLTAASALPRWKGIAVREGLPGARQDTTKAPGRGEWGLKYNLPSRVHTRTCTSYSYGRQFVNSEMRPSMTPVA